MTRSTIVLSLITLLALGGCNTPSESDLSKSDSNSGHSTEQLAENPNATGEEKPDKPPANVSQPVEETSDTTDVEEKATTSTAQPSVTTGASATDNVDSNEETGSSSDVTVMSAQAGITDHSIVPGEKVGVVTRNTSYTELETTFGSDRLTSQEIHLGEGMMAPSTQVTLDDGYSFNVVWSDESKSHPLEVRDLDTGWKVQGIYNGMPFEELKATLGEFELLGLGWDYGGTLLLENTPLAAYSGKLFIRVQPSEKAVETQHEKFLAVASDAPFASSDPNFSDLELSVIEVVVRLE